jgi:nucleotide-binding universal stress UspA family protein
METAMKNILLLVHDDTGQEARFQAALDLTRALDGHLTCIDVAVPPLAIGGGYGSAAGQGILIDLERAREAKNRAEIERRLAGEAVSWNWVDALDTIDHAVLDAAALADLIVLNRKLDSYRHPNMLDITSRVILHARKPVVAMPEEANRLELRRALIAWDGQSSCAATVRASVPLLQLADAVELFMVRDGSERTEPTDAAEYLSRHGVHADVRVIDDGLTAADDLISEEAVRWNADYVVMGAYGRGRLMETFGGVTKRMLAHSKFPLILAH